MLRFSRHLRQRLLTENKFGQYWLYAVGEIVLVVIGILIALQVDNWNEIRKKEGQGAEFRAQLREGVLAGRSSRAKSPCGCPTARIRPPGS